jgi:hypothetical protein
MCISHQSKQKTLDSKEKNKPMRKRVKTRLQTATTPAPTGKENNDDQEGISMTLRERERGSICHDNNDQETGEGKGGNKKTKRSNNHSSSLLIYPMCKQEGKKKRKKKEFRVGPNTFTHTHPATDRQTDKTDGQKSIIAS